MAIYIGRRQFIVTVGGAAAWLLAARAQQPAMPMVGFLHAGLLWRSSPRHVVTSASARENTPAKGYQPAHSLGIGLDPDCRFLVSPTLQNR
jgi:putative ABC transport system substrate-binding protein